MNAELMNQNFRTLTPAYGRDYKSGKAAIADFRANLDWRLQPEDILINAEQIAPGVTVHLRFGNLRKVIPCKR